MILATAFFLASAQAAPLPLRRAYSHNDYLQARPLDDALDRGFCAAEADVHLRGDELMIGHTGGDIKPGVTLRSLYLDPLLARVRKNGGRVYPGGPSFLLMVEFKSDGEDSYEALKEQLKPYAEMLSVYTKDRIEEKAVTVVITGHRPNERVDADPVRFAGIDGDINDLRKDDKTLFPTISEDWRSLFEWRGGPMGSFERERLTRYVREAHKRGRRLRFYAIPDREEGWDLLYKAGVDLINTDHLEPLRQFLLRRQGVSPRRQVAVSTPRFQ